MSGTIWLIVEDRSDAEAVKVILDKKRIAVRVEPRPPIGGTGGISRLAAQIEELIRDIRKQQKANDCIAVLHDFDEQKQQQFRGDYEKIELVAKREKIKLIIARDELEAWLLADSGVCKWLNIKQKRWDTEKKPKDALDRLMKREKGKKYQGSGRLDLLKHLAGDGDKLSKSMKDALAHLKDAPCIKS